MAQRKPDKTLADYVGIAISPVLIMVMIGSLVFFLLEIAYAGEFAGRLRWTIFWFVLAAVLVSRIAIEQGSGYASLYGVALAAATGLMISRFVNFPLGVWCVLGLIWWCASKLTWDCTLIDDEDDASGEGLLQIAGIDSEAKNAVQPSAAKAAAGPSIPLWRLLAKNQSERVGQPHAPGLWVVYVSLAALPLFGTGQLAIPAGDPARRQYGFVLLAVYTSAALGLLLTTSFLGLRRYLRQRRLQMPGAMARTWIAQGATLAAAILLLSILLPRPEASYSLTALVGKIGSPDVDATQFTLFRRSTTEGDDSGITQQNDGNDGETSGGATKREARGQSDGETGSTSPRQNPSGPASGLPQSLSGFARLLKWILYALFAAAILYFLIRNRVRLIEAAREVLQSIGKFLKRLLGSRERDGSPSRAEASSMNRGRRQRSFASFANPFASGAVQRMPVADLVCYSFEALQAWARETGVPRRMEQTPLEFARQLGMAVPELDNTVRQVAQVYGQIAYAGRTPGQDCLPLMREFWESLQAQ